MATSLDRLNGLWKDARQNLAPVQHNDPKLRAKSAMRTREAASLLAAGRWVYASANERTETRGLHRRTDFPDLDPKQNGQHILTGGLDDLWVKRKAWSPTLTLAQERAA
jgi:succinate dehydrogenase/fumarate reductase flavoprotein subunit